MFLPRIFLGSGVLRINYVLLNKVFSIWNSHTIIQLCKEVPNVFDAWMRLRFIVDVTLSHSPNMSTKCLKEQLFQNWSRLTILFHDSRRNVRCKLVIVHRCFQTFLAMWCICWDMIFPAVDRTYKTEAVN